MFDVPMKFEREEEPSKSFYLNTDLELYCEDRFDELAKVFEQQAVLMHYGKEGDGIWRAAIESKIGSSDVEKAPVDDIDFLLSIIEKLRGMTRTQWDDLDEADFNIGWQSASQNPYGELTLEPELLQRIVICQASVSVTIYPSSINDRESSE